MIFSRNHHIYLVIFACLLVNSSTSFAQTCAGDAGDLSIDDISLKWSSGPGTANSHGQPFVADLDNDGSPEVIVTNQQSGTLNILDGLNNGTYDAISKASPGAIDLGFKPFNTVAIASLDLGGVIGTRVCIVVAGYTGSLASPDYQISLWSYDGASMVQFWKEDLSTLTTSNADPGTIGIADFDGTGAQIYFANVVLNADGTVYAQGTDTDWPTSIGYGSLALDVLGDGNLELITAGKIWSVSAGTLTLLKDINDDIDADASIIGDYYVKTWRNAVPITESRVMISAADYDLDGDIELIFPGALGSSGTDATAIFQWDPENNEVTVFKTSNNHSRGAGRIAIGDTDGDGGMNALFVSGNTLYNLNENFQQQWNFTVTEGNTTGYGGVTLYDFNGDGKSEILYRDREYFKAFKDLGTTAQTILEAPCKSFTREEYPIVADINNDGQAEICFSCLYDNSTELSSNEDINSPLGAIRVYGASNGSRWQPTRGVWNQHAYMNVNIEDNLTIATTQNLLESVNAGADCYDGIAGNQNKPFNMFLSQAPLLTDDCPSFALPDLIIGSLNATTAGCPDTNFDLTYTLTNQGDVSVSGALPITFYAGDPSDASSTKLNTVSVNVVSLATNAAANFTSTVIGLGTNDFDWESNDLYVVINESGALPPITPTAALIPECDVSNNSASLNINYTNFDLSPTTGDGLSLTLTKVSDNIKCDPTKPNNGEVQVYYNGSIGGSTQTIFNEDFEDNSLSNLNSNNLSDPSGNWSASGGNTGATTDFWGVGVGRQSSGKTFMVNNGTNAVILETKSIDIATYTDVEIDIDAFTNNSLEVSGASKDEIEVYYSINDAAYEQVNTANTLLGSFSYKHINQDGLSGNTLKVKIEITNNDGAEYTEIDNISITGTLPAIDTDHRESSGFEFLWYLGDVTAQGTDFTNPVVHTGSSYTGMAKGTYTVRGRYISGNCFSEALDVTIDLVETDAFDLEGWQAQPLTDCMNPNGIAQAGVIVDTDTMMLNYEFTWYLSSEGVTALGTGYQLTNRTDADYKLVGVSTITGCSQVRGPISITTAQTLPDQPTVTVTNVLSCDDVNTGQLVASLPADANTYSYQWYSGRVVKPTADFNESLTEPSAGDTYALIPAGPYTVVAVNMLTKCQSNQLVVEVGPPDNYPTPELILDNANTSCNGNGQITARNGNGDVDWDLAANTFTFFDGNNTLAANRLGSAGITGSSTNNVASGLLDGMHTVQVTHTASGCTSTDTLTVPNEISEPVFNFTQTNVDTDNDNIIDRCESTTNLALTGTTNSSSQIGLKAGLIDEDVTTVFISDATQDNEWIEIDLGAVKSISDVLIFNNTSAALNRIQNVRVMISSSPFTDTGGAPLGSNADGFAAAKQNATFLYDIGSDYNGTAATTLESIVTIEAETSGRYLRVQKSGINLSDNILNIAEIQVFEACIDGIEAATIHNTSCGAANGAIDLTGLVDPTAGTTYSYTLYDGNDTTTPSANTTGASTGIFTGLAAATYTVLAEESNTGCSTSQRVLTILDKPDKPFVTTTVIDDLGCNLTGTGSVSVTAKMMGTDEPGSYNFDLFTTTDNTFADGARVGAVQNVTDGTVGFTFENLVDGTYSLRVSNADQTCYAVETIIIDNISVDPLINTDASTDNTGCSPNNGTIIISDVDSQTGNDLQANYTFSWVSSDGTDITPTDANKNVLDTLGGDTYTVTITSNTTGCSVDKNYVITNNAILPSLTVAQISANTYCVTNTGTGLALDGNNDYVALPMSYSAAIATFTAESWFNTTFNRGNNFGNWSFIDFDRSEYYNLSVTPSGAIGFHSWGGGINDMYTNETGYNDGDWHHVAAVYDGTDKIIYVDGVEIERRSNVHGGRTIGKGTRFGYIGDGSEATRENSSRNGHNYDGKIDDVRIWSTARSAAEIRGNMNTTLRGNEAGLEAYYKLDEGVSETNNTSIDAPSITPFINDSGPNLYHGKLYNSSRNGATSNWVEGAIVTPPKGDGVASATVTADGNTYDGSGNNYTFEWYLEDPVATPGTSIVETIGRPSTLANATYWIQTTNVATGCKSTVQEVIIDHDPTKPVIVYADSTSNTSCDPSNWTGSITVDVTLLGNDENEDDYTFYWDNNLPENIDGYTRLADYTEDGITHRYFLHRTNTNTGSKEKWPDARDRAEELGGYLFVPNSEAEQIFVANQVSRNRGETAWIGINDINQNNTWVDVLFQPLGVGQPNRGLDFVADPSIDESKWSRNGSGLRGGDRFMWNSWYEPNDSGDEDFAHFWGGGRRYWNDIGKNRSEYAVIEMEEVAGSTNKLDSIPSGTYTVTTVGPNGCESDPFTLTIHDVLPVIDVGFRYNLDEIACGDKSKNGIYNDINGGITIVPTIDGVGTTNWSLASNGATISMSSTVAGKEGPFAIDGDTDGAYGIDDIAETTGASAYDYIDITLSEPKLVSDIVIWNVEDQNAKRLENVQVMVSANPFTSDASLAGLNTAKANSETIGKDAGGLNLGNLTPVPYLKFRPLTPQFQWGIPYTNYRNAQIEINKTVQYIRLQKTGNNPGGNNLSIAEIQIYGSDMVFEFELQTVGGDILDANGETAGYQTLRYKTKGPTTTITGLKSGSYRVNLTDSEGTLCSNLYPEVGSFEIKSRNDDKPVIDAVALQAAHVPNSSCENPNGEANAHTFVRGGYGSFSYSWTKNGVVVDTDSLLSEAEEGDYGLEVTDNLTSCQVSTNITIDEDLAVIAAGESNLKNNTVCDPDLNDPAAPDANGEVTFTPTTDGTSSLNYTYDLSIGPPATEIQNALDFDGGDDYVEGSNDAAMAITGDITLEAWVFKEAGGIRDWYRIMGKGTGGNRTYGMWHHPNGNILFQRYGGGGQQNLNPRPGLTANTWTHIAMTQSGRTATIYINGIQIAQRTDFLTAPRTDANSFTIGYAGFHSVFPGLIDEVRVWNIARSQVQIQAAMNIELEDNDRTGLVAYYKLNEGTAGGDNTGINTITDSGPNNFTATPRNFDKNNEQSNWRAGKLTTSIPNVIDPIIGGAGIYSDIRYTDDTTSTTTVTGLPEGDYVMTVTDLASGCTDEYDFTILDQPNTNFTSFDLSGSITTIPDTQCNDDDGTIIMNFNALNVAPVDGSGNYTVKYYKGNSAIEPAAGSLSMSANGTAFTDLAGDDGASDGVYTVVVFDDATGCSTAPETFIIGFEPDRPNFTPVAVGDASSPTHDNSVCDKDATSSGTHNGQITINPDVPGTEADYTYAWFNGVGTSTPTTYTATDNVLSNAPAGTYTLQVTSIANDCDTTINFTIANDFTVTMTLNETITDMSVCEGNALYPNGVIDIVVNGGSGNYTYEWFYGSGADNTKKLNDVATIFAQKGTTGTSTQNVSGATTSGISFINGNGNPGTMQYTVKVLDTDRGCYETGTYAVGIEDPGLSVTAEVLIDNFSCDVASPTGSVGINASAGAATPQFEWYNGVGTGGVLVGATAIIEDLADGIYTVKFIDGSTNCFVTDQVTIGDYTPTVSASSTSNTAQTQCNPADGTATVVPAISFVNNANSATENPDDGWATGDYTYQWYLGLDLSTPLANGVDPGNGSTPADVTLATARGLAADNYTVEITETNTSCTQQVLITVADGISAGAPDLEFQVQDLPASCLAIGEFSTRLASNPTGNAFAFEFYEGAQDHTLDAVGTGLTTGDQLVGNPSQAITVVANSTAAIAGTWSDNSIADVMSKPYTIVVTDQTTGCRYQEYFSLGYAGQQTTTTLTVENVDECPDNGVARVGLADYVDNTDITTIANTTGFNAGQFDDISQYILYLYSGTGVPADQEAPYVVDGLTFPFLYDGATGIIKGGDGSVLTGGQAGPGVALAPGASAEFRGLPAGDYIAIAREQLQVSWQSGDTDQCWSAVSFDKELVDLAYAPIRNSAPVITSNTNCDVTQADGGNGQLSITVKEDPAENLNDAGDQQPAGYIFTWKNSSNVTVKTETKKTEVATSTTDADLVADTYTVTIQRALQTYTMSYASVSGTFLPGEKINITAGGAGSGYIQTVNSGASTLLFYPTSGTFIGGVTFTGVTSGAVGTQSAGVPALGPFSANGCELVETIILDDDPEKHVVNQATTIDYNNCDALPASTITISDNFILADGVGQLAADYTYEWFKSGTTAGDKIAGQTGSIIDLSALAAADPNFIIADRYYVVATNSSNGCITPTFEVNVIDNTSAPVVSITASTADTSCKAANEGNGDVTFVISTPQLNSNYTYQWYAGVDASGPALTDGGTISGTSGTLNGAANGNYTATLSGVDGGSYTLVVTDATIPNNTCATTTTTFINEDISQPTLVASNITLQDNQNCSSPNGYFEISSVSERGAANRVISAYSYIWFESDGTTPITGVLSDVGAGTDNRVDGLIGGTYKVQITNSTTECSEVIEFIIEDKSVNPLVNLVSSNDDAYCINSSYVGDGTITIEITDEGAIANLADFSVEWYRGRLNERPKNKDYTDSLAFLYDDIGTVPATGVSEGIAFDNAETRGDALVGSNILSLTGLASGDYTVYINKNNGASDVNGQNYDCEAIVTYTIDKNSPFLSVNHPATLGGAGSYAVVDNVECNPLSGSITLSEVLVDGAIVNLNNASPYTINWVGPGSGTIATSNAGVSIANDQLTLLDSATYTYTIANNVTGCSTQLTSVDVDSDVSLPFVSVEVVQEDIVCDDVTYTPTGEAHASIISRATIMPSANYSFTWYTDLAGTTLVTEPGVKTYFYDSLGNVVNNGDRGASILKNVPQGTYYVKSTDVVTPNLGCESTPMQSVIIPQFESTIFFGSVENTDFIRKNLDDCDPLNGSFEVLRISETRPLGQADFTSTNMADYTINWYESFFTDTTASTPAALGSVTTSATFPSSTKAATLPAGKYYFKVTNTSTTGCSQTDSTMSQFLIVDELIDPIIEFDTATNSNDCLRPLFEGDGTASIILPEDESRYSINWFRGDTVGVIYDSTWLFGSDVAAVNWRYDRDIYEFDTTINATIKIADLSLLNPLDSISDIGDTIIGTAAPNAGSYISLTGLADGFYSVLITDKITPGIGCVNTLTLQILNDEVNPFINVPEVQIVNNTRCDLPGNGSLLINSADITLTTGSSNIDDFNWFLTYDDGDSTTIGVDTLAVVTTGVGAASQIDMDSLESGSYIFVATSKVTYCKSGDYTIDILGRGVAPVIDDYTVTADADCAGDLRLGVIEIIRIDSFVVIPANYDLQWFVGTDTLGTTVDVTYAVDGTMSVLSGVPEGSYTIRVINTDNGNCTSIRTIVIENEPIYPIIEDFYVSTSNICPEVGFAPGNGYFELASIRYDGVTITDSTTLANEYTLEYAMTDYDASSPLKIDSLAPNTYSVYIRRNDSDCRSEEVTTFTIGNTQVDPIIIFNQIEADSTCSTTSTLPNGVLVATADGSSGPGYSFQWSDVSSTPLGTNDTLSGLYAGTYQLVVTDSITNCSATNTYPVTNVPFEFEINDYSFTDPTVCDPTNGILAVTSVDRISTRVGASALTYQFYEGDPANGGILVQDSNLNMFSAGVANTTYLFQATNPDYGCSSGLVQVFLSDSSLVFPVISLATSDFGLNSWNQFSCDPDGPTGRLSVAVDDINDNPDFTYEWTKIQISGALVISTVLPITTAVADSLAAGTYRVTATNIITQCQSSEEYSLIDEIQNPLVVSTSTSSNINCLNPNGQMGASVLDIGDNRAYKSALDAYTYYWFEGLITEVSPDVSLAKYIGITIDSVAAGIYTVYAVDNTTDCFTSDPTVPSSVVEVEDESTLPDLSVDVVNDLTICDPTMADGFAEIIDSENELFKYTIAWYTGIDTTQSVPFQYGTFADSLLAGDYLTMITNNITGCVQFESFTILDLTERVPAPNAVVLSDRTHCEYANGHAAVSVLGETDFYEFNWYLEADPRNVAFTGTEIDLLDTATYRVVAQNLTTTCYSEPTQITINNGISDPAFRVEVKASLCDRTEDGSVNQFTGGASIVFEEYHTIDSISWINEQGIEINYGDPKAFVLGNAAPGKYTVYFKPENGCLYEANFIIDASITIYNGLSANDDGNNDFFLIDCADFFENNNVKIYNIEGALIYEVDGYNNFNNRFEGYGNIGNSTDKLPVGTYYYIIDKGDGTTGYDGFLELVR